MHKKKRGESFRMSTNLIEQKGTEDSIQRRTLEKPFGKNPGQGLVFEKVSL